MYQQTKNLIDGAQELIDDDYDWCQGADARNEWEDPVSSQDEDACFWCLYGALKRSQINNNHPHDIFAEALHTVAQTIQDQENIPSTINKETDPTGYSSHEIITDFNDHTNTTYIDVSRILKKSYERAKESTQ